MTTLALPADTDLLALHRQAPLRYPLLLESVADGTPRARWDLLLLHDGTGLRLGVDGVLRRLGGGTPPAGHDFLAALDAEWAAARASSAVPGGATPPAPDAPAPDAPDLDAPPPFRGGWGLYLAYELAGQVEPVLRLPPAPDALPVALALRAPAAVLRDRASGRCWAVAEDAAAAARWLPAIAADAAAARALPPLAPLPAPAAIEEDAPARFLDGVRRVLDYLAAGDVFQANLSRAWRARFHAGDDARAADVHARAAQLYAALRAANPAPFAGLLVGEGDDGRPFGLASSSPERLVSLHGRHVETRPIAGTRPRLPGDDEAARIRELVGHPKERAEHVMLLDLERNDLGRVCTPGSVRVDELMVVESYAHVHHIVSNVRGELREGVGPGALVRAVFPGGTITGCPKVRCMQVIAELEGEGRGPYTGAIGWLDRGGDLDLNILIRSAWLTPDGLRLRTGAGIVVDSDPGRELDETRAKARGLLRALGDPA
jgi:anthranilate synthase component 1